MKNLEDDDPDNDSLQSKPQDDNQSQSNAFMDDQ